MAEETKNQNTQGTKNTDDEVTQENMKAPAWLEEGAKQETAPVEGAAEKPAADVPAWVKNAGNKEKAAPVKTEPAKPETAETKEEKTEKKNVMDKAAQKKSIFDNFKDMFSLSDKKRAEYALKATKNVATTKKEKEVPMTPEEQKRFKEAEKMYQEGLSTIRDLISPSSMDVEFDSIRVEGMYAQTFYVYAYPRYLDSNWLSPIINFDVTMDIAQFIYPIDSSAIMKVLKRKVAQMQSSIRMAADKGNVSDPAIETALQDAEELRTQIQRGQEKFYQFGLYITVYSEDKKKLTKVAKQLESVLGGKLVMTKKADFQTEHGFNSTLPLCLDELDITLNMNTSPLSTMFPFNSAELTSNKGILYGLNRHNDSLIIFDRFSLENANSVVFAKSGAGKSYAVKLEFYVHLCLDRT